MAKTVCKILGVVFFAGGVLGGSESGSSGFAGKFKQRRERKCYAGAVSFGARVALALLSLRVTWAAGFYLKRKFTPPRATNPGARNPFSKYLASKRFSAPPNRVITTRSPKARS